MAPVVRLIESHKTANIGVGRKLDGSPQIIAIEEEYVQYLE